MVVVLRVAAILAALLIGGALIAFLLTGNRRYLGIAWRVTRIALGVALLLFGLMVAERLAGPIFPS